MSNKREIQCKHLEVEQGICGKEDFWGFCPFYEHGIRQTLCVYHQNNQTIIQAKNAALDEAINKLVYGSLSNNAVKDWLSVNKDFIENLKRARDL